MNIQGTWPGGRIAKASTYRSDGGVDGEWIDDSPAGQVFDFDPKFIGADKNPDEVQAHAHHSWWDGVVKVEYTVNPDPETWRPAGWLGDDTRWTVAEIDEFHKLHIAKGWVTKRGIIVDDVVDDGEVIKKGCPDKKRLQVEAVAHNSALLRDCWATKPIVWQVIELFFGGPIETDPFWNPWGSLHPTTRLDGSPGFDGFAVDGDGRPKYWRGRVGANGPHSETSRTPDVPEGSAEEYKHGGWIRMCAEYGKTEQCAAVVPQRGDDWFYHYGAPCDLILEFGRLDFDAPPGIKASSNPGCTQVLLWLPDRKCSAPARRLFEQGSYQFVRPRKRPNKRTKKKESQVMVRPGIPVYSPETDNLLKLGES